MYFRHRQYSEDPIHYLWFYKIFSKIMINIKININNLIVINYPIMSKQQNTIWFYN